MKHLSLIIPAILICISTADAQDLKRIPSAVQRQMESMVGSWTFKGTEGDRTFSGEETIRLTNDNTAMLQEGYFELDDGTKEHYVILSGWDGTQNTILVRGFTVDGYTWTGKWKTLKNGTWKGTASGGPATFEVKKNSMRYEDSNDGTPWISKFTRKLK